MGVPLIMAETILKRAQLMPCGGAEIKALAADLPTDLAALDELLEQAKAERLDRAFSHIVLASIDREDPLDAKHLLTGIPLFYETPIFAATVGKFSGDVAEVLIRAVANGKTSWEVGLLSLLFAIWWSREHTDGKSVMDAVREAKKIARRPKRAQGQALLLAIAEEVKNEELYELVAPYNVPTKRKIMRDLIQGVKAIYKYPALIGFPEEAAHVHSGFTVRRAAPRVGRNEPCHCGSGNKYKRCCMAKDTERLRDSSDIPGMTREELVSQIEGHLTIERLKAMNHNELVRLDPAKVEPELHRPLLRQLNIKNEQEGVLRYFESFGYSRELDDQLLDAVNYGAEADKPEVVRRLLEIRGEPEEGLEKPSLKARILASGEKKGPLLEMIEAEAFEHIDDPQKIVDFAHSLLVGPNPVLGIHVARGALLLSNTFEADILLEKLLETRDQLDLSPFDPIEPLVDEFMQDELVRRREAEAESPADPEERQSLEESSAMIQQLRAELNQLRGELKSREGAAPDHELPSEEPLGEVQEPKAVTAAPEAAVGGKGAAPPRSSDEPEAPDPVVRELRQRLGRLKEDLKQRHAERNQLKRQLDQTRREMEALAAVQDASEQQDKRSIDPAEAELYLPEETLEAMPVRLPFFRDGFEKALKAVPLRVAQAAVRLIGGLAAGDRRAFRGSRRLKAHRDVHRQRVSGDYRLLYKVSADAVEVVDLINRQDLVRRLKSLE